MKDLRRWLQDVEAIGQLRHVEGADAELEIGIISELNCKRRGPALLFNNIKGYGPEFRIVTSTLLNAQRLALTFGYQGVGSDLDLVERMRGKITEYSAQAADYPWQEVSRGPVLERRARGAEVNLLELPAPKWHEHDGGRYVGTGCAVITRDPDSGTVNIGTYRVMVVDEKTVTIYLSLAHHGGMNVKKYHDRGEPAPIAISLGHHPLFLAVGALSIPYGVSEYGFAGAVIDEPIPVVLGDVTGLPFPANSEVVLEGFCSPNELRMEGPFGEYTGYYASGRGMAPAMDVQAVYRRAEPIILGAMPARPPHDYSYLISLLKTVAVRDSIAVEGIPDVKGVWFHEVAAGNFFVVASVRQRYPGHARQVGFYVAQCRVSASAMGRYVIVVDDDIDPTNLDEVIWALGTRSNPERDIDIIRNTYSTSLDPIFPKTGPSDVYFGSRAVIDACKPFDWIDDFPPTAASSRERALEIQEKWKHVLT